MNERGVARTTVTGALRGVLIEIAFLAVMALAALGLTLLITWLI